MKNILKKTRGLLEKKERDHFFFLITLDIFISIADILSLALLLWIIQFYVQPDSSQGLSFLPGWLQEKNSLALIAIYFFLFTAKNLAGFLITRAHYSFIGRVAVRISGNNLSDYQHAKFEEFTLRDSSVHIRKIGYQPFEFAQYILAGIQQIITQSFLIFLTIVVIILFNVKLFLLLIIILLPPVIIVFYFIKKRLTTAKKHIQSSNETSFRFLLDALKGYVEGNIYDRNEFFLRRFTRSRETFSRYLFDSLGMQSLPNRIIEIFAILGLFILIIIAVRSGNNDSGIFLTIGAFIAAAYKIIPGIVKIINVTGQMKAYELSIADHRPAEPGPPGSKAIASEPITRLELRNISFQYSQQPVLHDFSFTIEKGDFLGITGGSGKGKTTVFNLLLGFLEPVAGEILMNNEPVKPADIKQYWQSIAYVRQQAFFIHDTLRRNITLEEDGCDKNQLDNALLIAGLNELIAKYPEGMDKIISENGKNISGGQQQRIAIARAIYKDADLILLDEPFNELDEPSVTLLLQHFQQLSRKGKTIVMITHDKKSLAYCTKIISLDDQ